MLSAPLLLGHDVRKELPEIDQILLNRELTAINQDDLGVQAYLLPAMSNGDLCWQSLCTAATSPFASSTKGM